MHRFPPTCFGAPQEEVLCICCVFIQVHIRVIFISWNFWEFLCRMCSSQYAAFAFSVILKVWSSFAVTVDFVTACSVRHVVIAMYCYNHRHLVCVAQLFGAFALLKATLSFVSSVRPCGTNSTPTGRIFLKFDIRLFRKSLEKIQVSLKCESNDGCFTRRPVYFLNHFRSILRGMKSVSDKSSRENKKTLFFSITFFPLENRTVYEVGKVKVFPLQARCEPKGG